MTKCELHPATEQWAYIHNNDCIVLFLYFQNIDMSKLSDEEKWRFLLDCIKYILFIITEYSIHCL